MQTAATLRHYIAESLRLATGPIRPASILRIHEPDSPESIYLREQAARLKDSRKMAETLATEAAKGLESEEART